MSQTREPVEFVISVSILESYVFALNITKLMERCGTAKVFTAKGGEVRLARPKR